MENTAMSRHCPRTDMSIRKLTSHTHHIHIKQAFPNPGFHSDLNAEICPRLCPGAFLVLFIRLCPSCFQFPNRNWKTFWVWLDPAWRLAGDWAGGRWSLPGPDQAQPAARRDFRVPGKIL